MNKNLALIVVMGFCAYARADGMTNTRQALDTVIRRLDIRRDLVGMYFNYGIRCATNSEYRALAVAVSNEWQSVLGNLSRCATNQLERLLVLGVRDQFDEDFFYDYVEGVFGQWQAGRVSTAELQWIRHSDKPGFDHLFERRYNVERARRLVAKFQESEPNNMHWQKVLSGEAYTNYLEEVAAGLWK